MKKIVRCPGCGKKIEYSQDNPYRPFCCERCQMLDFGDWASGKFAIPAEDSADTTPPTKENTDPEED